MAKSWGPQPPPGPRCGWSSLCPLNARMPAMNSSSWHSMCPVTCCWWGTQVFVSSRRDRDVIFKDFVRLISLYFILIWMFPKIGVPPKMDGLLWKTRLKWMIWGYPYFWNHPYDDWLLSSSLSNHCYYCYFIALNAYGTILQFHSHTYCDVSNATTTLPGNCIEIFVYEFTYIHRKTPLQCNFWDPVHNHLLGVVPYPFIWV